MVLCCMCSFIIISFHCNYTDAMAFGSNTLCIVIHKVHTNALVGNPSRNQNCTFENDWSF